MSEEEKKTLKFWQENKIFEKSVVNRAKGKKFVFFEGPPTANNVPHMGHFETRVFKDVILRYKTMRGFFVPRVAGWDTHGLPVEVEVEKQLGLKTKKDIEKYGVAAFNKKCRESAWKYKELWEQMTHRIGFWIDMENAYITYENSYIEKLWGIIKEFAKKKFLYEDYKVLPWCARCGTAISSHELAQEYRTIIDKSVIVKFLILNPKSPVGDLESPLRDFQFSNSYFLAWTTTPWTLPGNVALAINPKEVYVAARAGEEIYILAKSKLNILENAKIVKEIKGSSLVGLEYKPLFDIPSLKNEKAFKVYSADFVTSDEGTGIVHTAVMYGEDDYKLGEKIGLPKYHTVDEEGKFTKDLKPYGLEGLSVRGQGERETEDKIIEYLRVNNLLLMVKEYEHDYPFCWRCKTPLLYYARKAWWVNVNKVRKNLLKNNEKINWHPDYLKHGRFGEWLKEEKNWALSRERFWGTPLPVWKCGGCNELEVIGSIDELKEKSRSRNNFIFMRHGEADHLVMGLLGPTEDTNEFTSHLTEKGKKEVELVTIALGKKVKKIDIIVHSTLIRTKETAEIIASQFDGVQFEERSDIKDINTQNESHKDVKKRMLNAIHDIDRKFNGKNILIISHGDPLWIFGGMRKNDYPATGQFYDVGVWVLPYDGDGNLDLHKPFIDDIYLLCGCGGIMNRVSEVVDVWFDSGSMPFASNPPGFPADYIVEAIDQTRGWFYSLLAVATLLGKDSPYKNVVSLGHLLDAKGKKMSKSLGNVVDPMGLIELYGADPARWYFFTINQPWDSKLFKEEDVKDVQRRFFVILQNVVNFLKMYKVEGEKWEIGNEKLIINKWVLLRLSKVIVDVTNKLDSYEVVGAARNLENFVTEDLSRWYIRRVRDVMKNESVEKTETSAVLEYILLELVKLLAPFSPFVSEKIYKDIGGEKESVHLDDYPNKKSKNEKLLEDMVEIRHIVSIALEARAAAGIKVRQPLQKLTIGSKEFGIKFDVENMELFNLIKEEVNVKEIYFDNSLSYGVQLDTNITPELKEEGILRDLTRAIQSARKVAGLTPKDKVTASLSASGETLKIARKFSEQIKKETNLKDITIQESEKLTISFT